MALITNKDLQIMFKVKDLLDSKINKNNGEHDILVEYLNMIERFVKDKQKQNKKSADYNKKNKEYHNLSNGLYWARRKNNKEKIEYYKNKLEQFKKEKNQTKVRYNN